MPLARRAAVYGLAVLTLINLLNYLDRYVVAALVSSLHRAGIAPSDAQAGTFMTAFMVVYMCAAPLFGVIGDRGSRTRAIAVGVLIWSIATALSGFARSYVQLLVGRAVVGIGEAAYGTISPALLSDYFPRERRGRVFAVFFMAIPVGAALGYIVGGLVNAAYGWPAAFFVAGVPGVLLSFAVLGLADPPRGIQDPEGAAHVPAGRAGVGPTLRLYWNLLNRQPYLLSVLGYAAYTFAVGGLAFWMPTFLERVRGLPAAQASTSFGIIVVVTGFVGTFAGGWLGDLWLKRSHEAYLWFSGLVTLLAVPAAVVALSAHSPALYFSATVVAELLIFMSTGPINSAIVNLVSPLERASAVALSVLAIHLLGDVFSPTVIGAISDRSSLGTAVLIVPAAIVVAGVIWIAAARAARTARLRG